MAARRLCFHISDMKWGSHYSSAAAKYFELQASVEQRVVAAAACVICLQTISKSATRFLRYVFIVVISSSTAEAVEMRRHGKNTLPLNGSIDTSAQLSASSARINVFHAYHVRPVVDLIEVIFYVIYETFTSPLARNV